MSLGAFSLSLTVQDIAASRAFYEVLGFDPIAGDEAQNWLILRNGECTIGLFHGMFERNMLTFNPGWAQDMSPLETFEDVRVLQERCRAAGIELMTETDPTGDGPASFVIKDPDGNPILIDQHR